MRPRDRYLVSAAASLAVSLVAGLVLMVAVARVAYDPTPTLGQALEDALAPFRFANESPWALAGFGAVLVLGLGGFALGWLWGYVILLAALLAAALGTFNPVAAAGAYVVIRSWHHFLHHDVHSVDEPAEWRHLLAAGVLIAAVFGTALAARSPLTRVRALRPATPAAPSATVIDQSRESSLAEAEMRLRAIEEVANVLNVHAARGGLFPVSALAQPIAPLKTEFAAPVQDSISRLPSEAATAYWSNGSTFLLFAALPIRFQHPRSVAVAPPAGLWLVRTNSDALGDLDYDGLGDADERRLGTSPVLADTDGDGYLDGLEAGTGHDPQGASLQTP